MKIVNTIAKILLALAAVAGAVYVIATYGDKIVAWAKNLLGCCKCGEECTCECDSDCECECTCECESAEDGEACICPCESIEEVVAAEIPTPEVPTETDAVVADEADFEG